MLCRNGRLQVSVTLDLKCSRQLKWESHRKPGGNLCFSDTVTHSLQMRQQQARIDTCRYLIAYLLWYPCPSQISTHSFSQCSPRTRSASGHYCRYQGYSCEPNKTSPLGANILGGGGRPQTNKQANKHSMPNSEKYYREKIPG